MYNKVYYPVCDPDNITTSSDGSVHHGQILEKTIRRNRMSISEISRRLNVSRQTLYNWFETERIDAEIIVRTGFVIGYDFSRDIPDINLVSINDKAEDDIIKVTDKSNDPIYYWMERYISLLEKFNEELRNKNYI